MMPKDKILDLQVCEDYFFSSKGNARVKHPKAWATDNDGRKWVEHDKKRCKLIDDFPPYILPIPYAKSGRD